MRKLVLDTETSGLSPEKDRIIELEINPLLVQPNEVFVADALIRENY